MNIQWETVSIPFVDGISPATRDRLLPATKLLALENGYLFNQRMIQKRHGHRAIRARTSTFNTPLAVTPPSFPPYRDAFSYDDPGVSENWLYGYGVFDPAANNNGSVNPNAVSSNNEAGLLFGSLTRDNETVAWDGFRTYSYSTNGASRLGESYSPPTRGAAIIPQLRSEPIAKVAYSQTFPDAADNGVVRVVAWIKGGTTYAYSVFDSVTGACLVDAKEEVLQGPLAVRVLACGGWMHIFIADHTATTLEMRSFYQDTPDTIVSRSFAAGITPFDVKKVDETQFLVVVCDAATPGVATMFLRHLDGSSKNTYSATFPGEPLRTVAVAARSQGAPTGLIVMVGDTNGLARCAEFDLYTGVQTALSVTLLGASMGKANKITVAPVYNTTYWDVYQETVAAAGTYGGLALKRSVQTWRVSNVNATFTMMAERFNVGLASHACYVGNRTFAWCYTDHTLQTSSYLMDATLKPVGKLCFALSNPNKFNNSKNTGFLPSMGFHQKAPVSSDQDKDRYVWSGCLSYKQRIENSALTHGAPTGIYAEPSVRFYQLDFLAPLRTAQVGRATYVAGAQLWEYDGTEFNEAGFNEAPEDILIAASATAGNPNGTYRYRVDLCYKNAQNEEVRSWSIIQPSVAPASKKVTITLPTFPATRREDAYFLIFRNQSNGTNWFLCSSRDPGVVGDNGFCGNDQTVGEVVFTDNLSDANLAVREYHPANAGGNYLDPLPSPACQVVAGGAGRLWLAGGELNAGEISPSRIFAVGESPAFHPVINIQIDRNIEPITAMTFQGDLGVVFRRTSAYFLETDGPDNTLNPLSWQQPRLALTEVGCIGQESIAVTTDGVWFQSLSGIRKLRPGGGLDPSPGDQVDTLAVGMHIAAAVVVPGDAQVRFYSRDPSSSTLVCNYANNAWSTWTNTHGVGASFWAGGNSAFVIRGDGYIWVEDPTVFTDGGSPYEFRLKTSWQHRGDLADFQRFRRFAVYGVLRGDHTLKCRLYYNEEPWWSEEFSQNFPPQPEGTGGAFLRGTFSDAFYLGDVGSNPAWGQFTWSAGSWGDASNVNGGSSIWFRDGLYRRRWRPARQKCSVFSIELSDNSAPTGSFAPVALGLEIGRKQGLDRIPAKS